MSINDFHKALLAEGFSSDIALLAVMAETIRRSAKHSKLIKETRDEEYERVWKRLRRVAGEYVEADLRTAMALALDCRPEWEDNQHAKAFGSLGGYAWKPVTFRELLEESNG